MLHKLPNNNLISSGLILLAPTVHQKIKVQASQRKIVLSADILAILPSSVVKEVQLSVPSARKGVTYQKHAKAQVNPQQNPILFHHIPNV